jgi:hypothetical protein
VPGALREAEVLGLGGPPQLARAVAATRLGREFSDGAYWRAALSWLVRWSDEIGLDRVGPVIDYLEAARGWSSVPPVAGRTATSLLRQVAAWHTSLGRVIADGLSWSGTDWAERTEHMPIADDQWGYWHLVELRDASALAAEGQALRHCVYTYRWRCRFGEASIWSLRYRVVRSGDPGRVRSVATMEVDLRTRTIVQLRGFANRPPRGPGIDVIRRWAHEHRLGWSGDVVASLAA